MKQHKFNKAQFAINMAQLPELCFAKSVMDDDALIIIRSGERGYYPVDMDKYVRGVGETIDQQVRRCNAAMGVTSAQMMAMMMGSIAGFDVPGADVSTRLLDGFIEDLKTVDLRLASEAIDMRRQGADYETVVGRFKAIYEQAAEARGEVAANA